MSELKSSVATVKKGGKGEEVIKVVVACYYPLLREGICKIFEGQKDIQVVSRYPIFWIWFKPVRN